MVATRENPMAKKTGMSSSEGKKTTVKVWEDIAHKAKIVAAIRGVDLFDYLDSVLRPIIERDHKQDVAKEAKE